MNYGKETMIKTKKIKNDLTTFVEEEYCPPNAQMFYHLLVEEFKKAGRTDYDECMLDLIRGDDRRFRREFGVELSQMYLYRQAINANLPVELRKPMQDIYFGRWLEEMVKERNWRID